MLNLLAVKAAELEIFDLDLKCNTILLKIVIEHLYIILIFIEGKGEQNVNETGQEIEISNAKKRCNCGQSRRITWGEL